MLLLLRGVLSSCKKSKTDVLNVSCDSMAIGTNAYLLLKFIIVVVVFYVALKSISIKYYSRLLYNVCELFN